MKKLSSSSRHNATEKKLSKFTDLFDKNWKSQRSTLRARTADDRSYDISYSWDARSDNPLAFTRMEATDVPVQPSRPICLSGTQIVTLEPQSGQFLNPDMPPVTQADIPLNTIQRDVGMSSDLTGNIPLVSNARQEGKSVTIERREVFSNMNVRAPTFKLEARPEYLDRAGPQADGCLLNVAQRRGISEFEKRESEAKGILRSANGARDKLRGQLGGPLFRRGVLMTESSQNPNSEIYGEKARSEQAFKQYRAQIHLERRSQLATKLSSIATNGNITVPDSIAARVKTEPDYQSKGGKDHAFSFEETHNRLFCRQERAGGAQRTQRIRDAELSGKQYNIVTLTAIEHWPSRSFNRLVNKNLNHESQTSLNHSRNMQGSLQPS